MARRTGLVSGVRLSAAGQFAQFEAKRGSGLLYRCSRIAVAHCGGDDSRGFSHFPLPSFQSNGFRIGTLKREKSRTLRVTTVRLYTSAVAAIMASS